ncbi:MAG: hypothetical protein AVDCRST_MAG49-2070, partial [uncultured Thermomicrobiales bacterium]
CTARARRQPPGRLRVTRSSPGGDPREGVRRAALPTIARRCQPSRAGAGHGAPLG